jgi:hypothetical protein
MKFPGHQMSDLKEIRTETTFNQSSKSECMIIFGRAIEKNLQSVMQPHSRLCSVFW